jgi:hypothetical protein
MKSNIEIKKNLIINKKRIPALYQNKEQINLLTEIKSIQIIYQDNL